jgi:hypothetical protein
VNLHAFGGLLMAAGALGLLVWARTLPEGNDDDDEE